MTTNKYGFINAREIFDLAEFVGNEEILTKRMEYYSGRNEKDGWTLDTVFDNLIKETMNR